MNDEYSMIFVDRNCYILHSLWQGLVHSSLSKLAQECGRGIINELTSNHKVGSGSGPFFKTATVLTMVIGLIIIVEE